MKSKFLIIISFLGLMAFSACEPNQEIYEQYENEYVLPYHESFTITLTDDDYSAISKSALAVAQTPVDSANAKAIDTYKSFSPDRSAETFIPYLLENSYVALDSSSSIIVDYNYDHSYIFSSDYVSINMNFDTQGQAESYIESQLVTLFTNPVEDDKCIFKYKILETENIANPDTIYIDSSYVYTRLFYRYDGEEWTIPSDSYILTSEDYDSMGTAEGQPGEYNNFSSSIKPEDYLPSLLKMKFPYTANNSTVEVIYDYYSNVNEIHSSLYFFDGQAWNNMEKKSGQFIHNGIGWFFDPTVKYTMNSEDYQIIVDYIINHPTLNVYVGYDSRREFWFGVNAKYSDIDIFIPDRLENDPLGTLTGLSDEDIADTLTNRIKDGLYIFIKERFPDAQPFSNGIPVYYEIYYGTFEPTLHTYYTRFLCTEVGEFEYVDGPFFVK